jgi:hypothetical protein
MGKIAIAAAKTAIRDNVAAGRLILKIFFMFVNYPWHAMYHMRRLFPHFMALI